MILNSNLEEYFAEVLLCDRLKPRLCDICAKRGQLESLKWETCSSAAKLNLQVKNMNLSTRGSLLATLHPGSHGPRIRMPRGRLI